MNSSYSNNLHSIGVPICYKGFWCIHFPLKGHDRQNGAESMNVMVGVGEKKQTVSAMNIIGARFAKRTVAVSALMI